MPDSAPALSHEQLARIAKLARLRLAEAEAELLRVELTAILGHIAKLNELDLSDVEPLDHPTDLMNRPADDVAGPTLATELLLRGVPASEGPFLAVPKILHGEEE